MIGRLIGYLRAHVVMFGIGIFVVVGAVGVVVLQSREAVIPDSFYVEPISWEEVGIDATNPAQGPQFYPIAAQICNTETTPIDVRITFDWSDEQDLYTGHPYINLQNCSNATQQIDNLAPGTCQSVTFTSKITPIIEAIDATRAYQLTAYEANRDATFTYNQTIHVNGMQAVDAMNSGAIAIGAYRGDGDLNQIPDSYFKSIDFGTRITPASTQNGILIRTYTNLFDADYRALQGFVFFDNAQVITKRVASSLVPQQTSQLPLTGEWFYVNPCEWHNGRCATDGAVGGQFVQTTALQINPGAHNLINAYLLHYGYQRNAFVYNRDYLTDRIQIQLNDHAQADTCGNNALTNTTILPMQGATKTTKPLQIKRTATPRITATDTATYTITPTASDTATPSYTPTISVTATLEPTITQTYVDDVIYVEATATETAVILEVTPTMRFGGDDIQPTVRPRTVTPIPATRTAVPEPTMRPPTFTATRTAVPEPTMRPPTFTATRTAVPEPTMRPTITFVGEGMAPPVP